MSVEIVFDIPVAQIINTRADPDIEPLVKHRKGFLLGPDRAVAHPTVKLCLEQEPPAFSDNRFHVRARHHFGREIDARLMDLWVEGRARRTVGPIDVRLLGGDDDSGAVDGSHAGQRLPRGRYEPDLPMRLIAARRSAVPTCVYRLAVSE